MGSGSATFTKWLVGEGPEMVGVAGGVVGDGTYSGRVLELEPGDTTVVRAVFSLALASTNLRSEQGAEQGLALERLVGEQAMMRPVGKPDAGVATK